MNQSQSCDVCTADNNWEFSKVCAELPPVKKTRKSRRARKAMKAKKFCEAKKDCASQTDGNIYHSENKPVTWEVGMNSAKARQTDVIVYWGICDRCQWIGVYNLPN